MCVIILPLFLLLCSGCLTGLDCIFKILQTAFKTMLGHDNFLSELLSEYTTKKILIM